MDHTQALIMDIENGLLTTPTYILGYSRMQVSLSERMRYYRVPGVSLAVINNYRLEWAKGYGVAEAGGARPVTVDTHFYAASVSKPLAAAAALAFVQAGLLDLDEDINNKLVPWKVPENEYTRTEKVTLRRLLSHSDGLDAGSYRGYGAG